jgi:hypothetical protein
MTICWLWEMHLFGKDSEWNDGKRVAILTSDKGNFKPKLVRGLKRSSLYSDTGNKPAWGDNTCKHTHTDHWHTQFHKTNTTGHKSTDWPTTQ